MLSPMPPHNLFYAQSGGVTPVINATACAVIETARKSRRIRRVLAGRNGILGALREELIETGKESPAEIAALRHTPGGAFGSCRYKLPDSKENPAIYERLLAVCAAHDIGYFLYNGGGDSQDTTCRIADFSRQAGYPLRCIGIPKTIDNDLPLTDNSPGFGTVAKYVAVSVRETGLDVAAMCETSTCVFILEVMGRHAGWIAAAAGLAAEQPGDPPHLILFPEVRFDEKTFLLAVQRAVGRYGYCTVVVSEGVRRSDGSFLSAAGGRDAFGHAQLGGAAPHLAALVQKQLGYKYHWAVADYLQRSARHIAAKVDVEQAYAVGQAAVQFALAGKSDVMPIIRRGRGRRYTWCVGEAPVSRVANTERVVPRSWIRRDGFGITARARQYLLPLIQGEDYPPYRNGLPRYARLRGIRTRRRLPPFDV